jgi:tRNA dimethylallyltransferase
MNIIQKKARNKILVILGPTSSGKSDIAIKLSKKFNGEIISADSRQIFRGMNIGTGKIEGKYDYSKKVFLSRGILHHMIDIVSPRTDFNVAKFKKQAEKIIEDILQRGKLPIVCGGTGFWIQAIVDDVNFPDVKPDWELRRRLEKQSAERLFLMLNKLDSTRAENIDSKNKVRLIRAIEICKSIGKVPLLACHSDRPAAAGSGGICVHQQTTSHRVINADPSTTLRFARDDKKNHAFLQIGIKLPKEKLYQNIEKRVLIRFKQGMIDEVQRLHNTGLSWRKIQSFGLAYFWIPLYLQKILSKVELVENVTSAEKKYAKRQLTWFKRDKRIEWIEKYTKIENTVKIFLN